MSLRCSLTGHDWGESQTRTHTDKGQDEVTVTRVVYQVCKKCDKERIISENTEVKTRKEETKMPEKEENDETETSEDDDAVILSSSASQDDKNDEDDEEEEVSERMKEFEGTEVDQSGKRRREQDEYTGVYVCPRCGFKQDVGGSLREGDICPECGKGYLEETNPA